MTGVSLALAVAHDHKLSRSDDRDDLPTRGDWRSSRSRLGPLNMATAAQTPCPPQSMPKTKTFNNRPYCCEDTIGTVVTREVEAAHNRFLERP